eukprot:CAMPEP_0114108500 /NCGR_PEP_ID=MMETSP0043_2-20121206/262_1 /TAXON_ID=464988 /ORGANISM="Hemiselmis andersenii, Strain CCMP644" /LENGTH=140 /DNA_ID=CAMNT_0001200287 /DNA_START=116 /DNA_END=534 /DNA_ORIENTATION=-
MRHLGPPAGRRRGADPTPPDPLRDIDHLPVVQGLATMRRPVQAVNVRVLVALVTVILVHVSPHDVKALPEQPHKRVLVDRAHLAPPVGRHRCRPWLVPQERDLSEVGSFTVPLDNPCWPACPRRARRHRPPLLDEEEEVT